MQNKLVKLSSTAVLALALISCVVISVFALPSFDKSKTLTITTDKETYSANEDVKVNVKFTNASDSDLSGVLLKADLPQGLKEKNGKSLKVFSDSVQKNGNISLEFVAVSDDGSVSPATPTEGGNVQPTGSSNQPTGSDTQPTGSGVQPTGSNNSGSSSSNNTSANTTSANTTASDGKAVNTGSGIAYLIIVLSVLAVSAVLVYVFRKNKKATAMLSLVLCAGIITTIAAPVAKVSAEGNADAFYGFEQKKVINIDGTDYTIEAEVKINYNGEDIPTDPSVPEEPEQYTISNIRNYIVGINEPVELADGTKTPLINFDNAATTPAFTAVMNEVNKELGMYGSIGRGYSQKSDHSTDVYNDTREKVKKFLGVTEDYSYDYTCVYVNNTTDGLNKLASALIKSKNDIVLTTRIEHHSNDLSWRERCKVIYAEVDEQGRVKYDDIERLLKENKVKLVSVTAASNVTGYVTDVHRVAKLAHKYGAKIVVDGAQIVAHRKFSMIGDTPEENIDFFVFSAHKMYTPYGGGAIVGTTEGLNEGMPDVYGGGTIDIVGDDWETYKQAPGSYEAGSPNYPSVVGLSKAIDVMSDIGFDDIEAHEKALNRRLINGLKAMDNIILYGDTENIDDRVGVVTFKFSDINSLTLATKIKEVGGVATRRGAFCAHPYVWRLMGIPDEQVHTYEHCADVKTPGMIRVSFGIYNTEEEVDQFLARLPIAKQKAIEYVESIPIEEMRPQPQF